MSSPHVIRHGDNVTITIGGVEIKGILDKGLEMTNKEKYIPKVGEAFKYKHNFTNWMTANPAVLVTPLEVVWLDDKGITQFACIEKAEFRSIQTKADVEREQLIDIMNRIFYGKDIHKIHAVQEIQNLNFTITKKVKRSEIADVVANTSPMISVEDLVDEICNLLGDLVDDD